MDPLWRRVLHFHPPSVGTATGFANEIPVDYVVASHVRFVQRATQERIAAEAMLPRETLQFVIC